MHHLGYVFQQFWNQDEQARTQERRRSRRPQRPSLPSRNRRRPDSF